MENILNVVEDIKEKIEDNEYKTIMDNLKIIHDKDKPDYENEFLKIIKNMHQEQKEIYNREHNLGEISISILSLMEILLYNKYRYTDNKNDIVPFDFIIDSFLRSTFRSHLFEERFLRENFMKLFKKGNRVSNKDGIIIIHGLKIW